MKREKKETNMNTDCGTCKMQWKRAMQWDKNASADRVCEREIGGKRKKEREKIEYEMFDLYWIFGM